MASRSYGLQRTLALLCIAVTVWLCVLPCNAQSAQNKPEVRSLKITILSTMLADSGIGEWGFAALVEADGHKILFDTGARPNTVLENARDCGRHQRLAKSDHVTDENTSPFVQVMSSDFHRCGLKLEELLGEITREPELREAGTSFLRKMIGHLEVNVVRRKSLFPRPAFLNDVE